MNTLCEISFQIKPSKEKLRHIHFMPMNQIDLEVEESYTDVQIKNALIELYGESYFDGEICNIECYRN